MLHPRQPAVYILMAVLQTARLNMTVWIPIVFAALVIPAAAGPERRILPSKGLRKRPVRAERGS